MYNTSTQIESLGSEPPPPYDNLPPQSAPSSSPPSQSYRRSTRQSVRLTVYLRGSSAQDELFSSVEKEDVILIERDMTFAAFQQILHGRYIGHFAGTTAGDDPLHKTLYLPTSAPFAVCASNRDDMKSFLLHQCGSTVLDAAFIRTEVRDDLSRTQAHSETLNDRLQPHRQDVSDQGPSRKAQDRQEPIDPATLPQEQRPTLRSASRSRARGKSPLPSTNTTSLLADTEVEHSRAKIRSDAGTEQRPGNSTATPFGHTTNQPSEWQVRLQEQE